MVRRGRDLAFECNLIRDGQSATAHKALCACCKIYDLAKQYLWVMVDQNESCYTPVRERRTATTMFLGYTEVDGNKDFRLRSLQPPNVSENQTSTDFRI